MTDDLVKRLLGWAKDIQQGSTAVWAMDLDLKEAAGRIESLTAECDRLRAALVVLADDNNWFSTYDLGSEVIASWRGDGEPDAIARAALKGESHE